MSNTNKIISAIIILIIIAGGSFYGGMLYAKSQATNSAEANRAGFAGLANRTGRTGDGANFTTGSIIGKDSTSITLQLPGTGGSKIIFYSTTTPISKMTSGTSTDLANGTNVSVTGTTNADGTITAQSIQIRPAGQGAPTPGQ